MVLRPEPGAAQTAARLTALGVPVRRQPLFAVRPVTWHAPDPDRFDALLLTSANAVRHAGPELQRLRALPVLAVGAATAAVASAAGLTVELIGNADAAALVERGRAAGFARLLHLAGRERTQTGAAVVTVYGSDPAPIDAATARGWADQVALRHSPRAARRFAALADAHGVDRTRIAVAALSAAVADAAGDGWGLRVAADRPADAALVALTAALIDQPGVRADNRAR